MIMDHRLDKPQYEALLKEVRRLDQDIKDLKDILLLLAASNINAGAMGITIAYAKQLKEQMLEEKRKELVK